MDVLMRMLGWVGLESAERYGTRKAEQHARRIRVSSAQERLTNIGRRLATAGAPDRRRWARISG